MSEDLAFFVFVLPGAGSFGVSWREHRLFPLVILLVFSTCNDRSFFFPFLLLLLDGNDSHLPFAKDLPYSFFPLLRSALISAENFRSAPKVFLSAAYLIVGVPTRDCFLVTDGVQIFSSVKLISIAPGVVWLVELAVCFLEPLLEAFEYGIGPDTGAFAVMVVATLPQLLALGKNGRAIVRVT